MHLLSVAGARPQFIKVAMILDAIRRHNLRAAVHPPLRHTLIHTGQHYDANMSDCFFRELVLPAPQYNLGVGSGSHAQQTGLMLERMEEILLREKPDLVLTYGDTNSTLSAALAAAKLNLPIAHIEAGLRSFNRTMAEEINRVLTDHLSALLFCPTTTAVDNLHKEGILDGVYLCGDVMLDAVLDWRARSSHRNDVLQRLGIEWGSFLLVTLHRAENTDVRERLASVLDALLTLPYPVVFPVHPRTRARIEADELLTSLWQRVCAAPMIRTLAPVSYLDMLGLEESARVIVTDSGGVQKEAYFMGVPCLTVRDETEWPETLRDGWNTLVPLNGSHPLVNAAMFTWENAPTLVQGGTDRLAFGHGRAAEDIVRIITQASTITTGRAA